MKNECFYYLLDEGKYYVSEGKASYNIENAKRFKSIEDAVKTTPIMKDWNWDYRLYKKDGDKIELIADKIWMDIHRKWEIENPDEYNKIYNTQTTHFIRVTK